MGNLLCAKELPECKHELLNEHNERYFTKVQSRNSTQHYSRRYWCRKKRSRYDPWELAILTDNRTISVEREEEMTVAPSPSVATVSPVHVDNNDEQQWNRKRKKRTKTAEGWQVKRKGNALKLRLAKNRRLQLTTSVSQSPVPLDSVEKAPEEVFNPLIETPVLEDLNSDFEDMISSGMVWVELARTSTVTAVAMSRTHEDRLGYPLLLAVGGEDGLITVTQILDEQPTFVSGHIDSSCSSDAKKFGGTLEFPQNGRVRSLDFSPEGDYLVVGSDGCTTSLVRLVFDLNTRSLKNLQVLRQLERVDRVYTVQFSPDGELLAVGGFDGKVAIVSMDSLLSSNDPSLIEISRPGLIFCLDWSPDGSFLAIGGSDKCCAVLERSSWQIVREIVRSTSVQTVKWNSQGTCLAIGDRDVALLENESFDVKCEISNMNHSRAGVTSRYRVSALCWSPDGSYLAVGGSDGCCLVVECQGYALVHQVRRSGSISCLAWGQQKILNGDYRRYLSISDDSCNVALLKAGADITGSVSEIDDQSSAASSSLFSTENEWVLREDCFRDIEERTPESPHQIQDHGNVTAVAFSRASKLKISSYLAYTADDCSLTIIATRDWKAVFQMEFVKPIRTIMFSNLNNYLALAGDEGVLYVLSVPNRSIILNTVFTMPIHSVAFSKQDERLSVGSSDGILTLMGSEDNWEPIGEIEHSEAAVLTQDWSNKNLAVGRDDGSVDVFQTDNLYSNFFVPETELSLKQPVRSVAFGASGRFLAVGGDGGTIAIFSAKGGWVLCHQLVLGCTIFATSWNPSGRYFAFAGKNQLSRIVDTISWADVDEVSSTLSSMFAAEDSNNGSKSNISSIDWSIDGEWVVFGSTGRGINVLRTTDWHLLAPSLDNLCFLTSPSQEEELLTSPSPPKEESEDDDREEEGVTYASF